MGSRGIKPETLWLSSCQVYYVDYGFTVETAATNLLELHEDFLSLPLQATNVRLAGTSHLCLHPFSFSSKPFV